MPIATSAAIALGVGAAASGAAGLIGHMANMSAQDRAQLLQEKGVQEWLALHIPDPATQKLALQKFVQTGELTPELEAPVKAAESKLGEIMADPRLKEARMRALGSLEEQGYGGEDIQDAAAREKGIIESGAANRGRQQAITADLDRRGQLGTGLELSARMDEQQAEGDRLSKQSLDLESNRRIRQLNAIAGAGELAGNIEGQEYGMARDKATAADAINLFNTKNMQDVMGRNVAAKNDAARYNLDKSQAVSDKNTAMSNFEQQYNKELEQQKFENEKAKAAGVSGQYGQQAAGQVAAGQSAAQMWGGIASGVGQLGYGASKLFNDNSNAAKELEALKKKGG